MLVSLLLTSSLYNGQLDKLNNLCGHPVEGNGFASLCSLQRLPSIHLIKPGTRLQTDSRVAVRLILVHLIGNISRRRTVSLPMHRSRRPMLLLIRILDPTFAVICNLSPQSTYCTLSAGRRHETCIAAGSSRGDLTAGGYFRVLAYHLCGSFTLSQ